VLTRTIEVMVANGTLDTVVTLIWVGALALVLLVQAFVGWLAHRYVTRSARMAARLAGATAPREAAPPVAPPVPLPTKPRLEIVHETREAAR
jgi:hypothetical protein